MESNTIVKITLFVGLNDKDAKTQIISSVDAANRVNREIVRKFGFGTVTESVGIYTHENSTAVVVENTLRIELLFFDMTKSQAKNAVIPFVETVKNFLNQESVACQIQEVESELI